MSYNWTMIVFDSSTIILLAKIDLLEIFVSSFHGKILIPEKVKAETCIKGRDETPLILKLIKDKKICVVNVKKGKQIKMIMEDFNIDIGEAETLILAFQKGASAIAADDRNAIRACKMLKIHFVTAITFLIRAFEKGLIEKEDALLKLQKLQSYGRYSKVILENATDKIKGGVQDGH
jgi:predicted nucleic acid-binding protein